MKLLSQYLIIIAVRKKLEVYPTQIHLRFLNQRKPKNAYCNKGLRLLLNSSPYVQLNSAFPGHSKFNSKLPLASMYLNLLILKCVNLSTN